MFRRFLLSVSLLLLIGGVCLLRSYRFERMADMPVIGLSQLKAMISELPEGAEWVEGAHGSVLRTAAIPGRKHVALKFRLPLAEPVQALHVSLDMEARQLVRGENEWDEGRVLIQWLSPGDNRKLEADPVAAASGSEYKNHVSLVARPSDGRGFPVLLVQNLGASGELVIRSLEVSPVRERLGWHWMRWVTAVCWVSWIVAILSGFPKISFPRRCVAAAGWVLLGSMFAFPGPWKTLPPIILPYELGGTGEPGDENAAQVDGNVPATPQMETPHSSESREAYGKIPIQEGWIIKAKNQLRDMRLLLHVCFAFFTTVVFWWLVGVERAAWLSAGLVVAIEASQAAFGFGFDWRDVLDLGSGAIGILLALKICGKLSGQIDRLPGVFAPPA